MRTVRADPYLLPRSTAQASRPSEAGRTFQGSSNSSLSIYADPFSSCAKNYANYCVKIMKNFAKII